ncbi:cytokine receptor-like factor 2 isoform X2 [Choloepus didactylus]|uniref:cytokine receptor-like factor 2 isoform X2 n=1 Tax=Choloepus didactylus TaxID=27675 RepID=UPI00189DBE4A|nr:cytokine receptor-like factor 2 isoform X2 [Choloepus didactylus]
MGSTWRPKLSKNGEEMQLQLIDFNFETMHVTWNASKYSETNLTFFYKLNEDEVYCECPNYILHEHHTAGCILKAGDDFLDFSILNGAYLLLTMNLWTSTYLKPNSPKDVNFLWDHEAVTITCSDLLYNGLLYEIQHRSNFDAEWQSKEEETCNVTIEGLDDVKCYYFRARVRTKESTYGHDTYPSDWSEVMHWQRGQPRDMCLQEKKTFPTYILISSPVALLTSALLLLSLWKQRRVRKLLMPSVPDLKFTFPGLFEDHRGNFQEWIKDTQNVAPLNKMEDGEKECVLEDVPVTQLVKVEVDMPTIGHLCPQVEEEVAGGSGQLPHQLPQGGDVISLSGFRFLMNDDAYVTL